MKNTENTLQGMPHDPLSDEWDTWSAEPEDTDEFEGWKVLNKGQNVAQFFSIEAATNYMKLQQAPTAEYPLGVPGYEIQRTVAPFDTEGEI